MNSHRRDASHSVEANGSGQLRVLCAEDDEQVARLLEIALKHTGHLVERVVDGRQALERITSDLSFFDLLLTDHEMPRSSGLDLVKKLRATAFSGRIIVFSSELLAVDAAAYRRLGVDRIFTKPAQLSELLKVVHRLRAVAP